jgi:soluble lytic murein transglycosylase-like protein
VNTQRRIGSALGVWALALGAWAAGDLVAAAPSPYRLQIDPAQYRLQPNPDWKLPPPRVHNPIVAARPYAEEIRTAAEQAGVEVEFLHAVVKVESAYRAQALSPKGARGLAQLMPATAERFGTTAEAQPVRNLLAGARYLRLLLDSFNGDKVLAAAAYNAGEGAVRRHGGVPPYAETRAYVPRVLAEYAALKRAERVLPAPWQLDPVRITEAQRASDSLTAAAQ